MRALIVDDNADNLYLLRALLQGHGYEVEEARNGAEALRLARQQPPDVAISDLMMPVVDGYTLLRYWRADKLLEAIPFVVYTATYTEPKDERLAMALGADAYLLKPLDPDVFVARLDDVLAKRQRGAAQRAAARVPDDYSLLEAYNNVLLAKLEKRNEQLEQMVREMRDEIASRKRTEDRLAQVAQHDMLTGLPNRILLFDRVKVALAQAQRSGRKLALMFLDLDRFKVVNDSFGHALGDDILREVATRLADNVRDTDTVSRQGGDEFLVALPDIDSEQEAARVAQKLLVALAGPFTRGGSEIVLTGSIGIACFPDNGHDAETLLRNADAAMYAAKQAGRNRAGFYSAAMNARAQERLRLEGDLRHAVERGQLFIAYQPQFDLGSGQLIGLEALARWRHPTRGMIPPAEFIPIAEESSLIVPIGLWIFEAACARHAAWVAAGLVSGTIAVNVSAHQFHQPDFVEAVAAVLERTGLAPALLELEVTESIVMQGMDQVRQKLDRLNVLGVKVAIDDFGTGYSSLSYLKQFQIHRLKIDQSFTHSLPEDGENSAIVQAVLGMAHSLGLNVLAEGIETPAQEQHLRALGCDAAQGYLYAWPMPEEELMAFLRERPPASRPG